MPEARLQPKYSSKCKKRGRQQAGPDTLEWFISFSCNIQDFGAYKLTFLFYTARVKSEIAAM